MSKQIVIDIKALDHLSAPVRGMMGDLLRMGDASIKMEKDATSSFKKIMGSVISVRGMIVGLIGTAAAGFGAAALWKGLVGTAEQMDRIGDEAIRLGMGVEQLSQLKYTADLANVSFESLANGIFTAQKNIGTFVVTGSGRAAPALRALGVPLRDANGQVRQMTELLPDFIDALNAIPDINKRNFLASKLFGDGPEFIRLLAEGGDRLRAFNSEAKALGVVFTPEQIKKANEFRDSLDRVSAAWFGVRAAAVVRASPALTDLLNAAAPRIAAIPEMVENLFGNIRDALSDGPNRKAARDKFSEFFGSLGDLAWAGIKGVGLVTIAAGSEVGALVVKTIFRKLMGYGADAITDLMVGYTAMVDTGVKILAARSPQMAKAVRAVFPLATGFAEELRDGMMGLADDAETTSQAVKRVAGTMDQDLVPTVRRVMTDMRGEIDATSERFLTSADSIVGWTKAMARTSIPKLPDRPKQLVVEDTRRDWTGEWIDGLTQGLTDFKDKARETFELGRSMALSFADSMTDDLTSAIVDVAGGVRSLKDAMRELGASTLRMLSEMIVKFLLLRAVTGFFSAPSVTAGSVGSIGGTGGVGGAASFGGAGAGVFANTGGVILPGRIERFARGGISRGIAALLTPREMIVSPEGVRKNPDVLARINRGERIDLGLGGLGKYAAMLIGSASLSAAAGPVVNGKDFAYGALVPGPNVNQDIVPARLPAGAGVISRKGVENNDVRMLTLIARGVDVESGFLVAGGTREKPQKLNLGGIVGGGVFARPESTWRDDLASVARAPVGAGRVGVAGDGPASQYRGGGSSGPVSVSVNVPVTVNVTSAAGAGVSEIQKAMAGVGQQVAEIVVRQLEARGAIRDRMREALR